MTVYPINPSRSPGSLPRLEGSPRQPGNRPRVEESRPYILASLGRFREGNCGFVPRCLESRSELYRPSPRVRLFSIVGTNVRDKGSRVRQETPASHFFMYQCGRSASSKGARCEKTRISNLPRLQSPAHRFRVARSRM
jgi:hypothetical protein